MIEIIIPAYNCTSTLDRTLKSLVKQTDKNFSVLVVDDCSTEDISTIVTNYADMLSIQIIRNESNLGVALTRQVGIDKTTADYICFVDADDILLPNAVEDWSTEIEKNNPDIIATPIIYVRGRHPVVRKEFWMCHGKVYKVSFLREFDIREHADVKCFDDLYLNWQAFSLTKNFSILTEPTAVQIFTDGSVTCQTGFKEQAKREFPTAKRMAFEKIARFHNNGFYWYAIAELRARLMCKKNFQQILRKLNFEHIFEENRKEA